MALWRQPAKCTWWYFGMTFSVQLAGFHFAFFVCLFLVFNLVNINLSLNKAGSTFFFGSVTAHSCLVR